MSDDDRKLRQAAATSFLRLFARDAVTTLGNQLKNTTDNLNAVASSYIHPERKRLLVEGDSWACYPSPANKDLTDFLKPYYIINNRAAARDMLKNMTRPKNIRFLIDQMRSDQIEIMLLSAGGNDMLGQNFNSFIRNNPSGDSAEDFMDHTNFRRELDELFGYFKLMISAMTAGHPKATIFAHSYVDPIPYVKGSWLGRRMYEKNIPEPYWQKIVRFMMSEFRNRLELIASRNFIHININDGFPNDASLWHNEIHLNATGLEIAATRIHERIESTLIRLDT